jgi:site-specific recombinase XerD
MNNLIIQKESTIIETVDFDSVVPEFFKYIDVKPGTEKGYWGGIKNFLQFLVENNIKYPTRETVILFKNYLKSSVKPGTVNLYLIAVKKFFSWLEETNRYTNVAETVKGVESSKYDKKDALNKQQIKTLLESFDTTTVVGKRDKAMIALMLSCGLRDIEVSRLEKNDFFMDDGNFYAWVQGKGRDSKNEMVFVPMDTYLLYREYLKSRKDGSNYSFVGESNRSNKNLAPGSISRIVKTALRAIGLDNERLTAHSLRHTAVTMALKAKIDITEVQQFARHANIQTTMIYNHNIDKIKARFNCGNAIVNGIF